MSWKRNDIIANQLPWLSLFFLLYAIWLVPSTLGLRYFCLVTGSIFGLYQIVKNFNLINLKNYRDILLIYSLFIIVIVHYLFNSDGSDLIGNEFSVIWKKVFLGVTFAIGLGLILRKEKTLRYKNIFIFSLFLPVAMFIAIYFFNNTINLGYTNPLIIVNYFDPGKDNYISKFQYVFFVMPILGMGFYEFKASLEVQGNLIKNILILFLLLAILSSFYLVDGKNGFLYFITCFLFFIIGAVFKYKSSIKKIILMLVFSVFVLFIARQHFLNEPAWQHLDTDIQIALDTDKYDHWKHSDQTVILRNEYGQRVSETTYLRIAWLKEGLLLAIKYPMGYGLIQDSFKYLGKKEWDDASLTHSHWGWLDLTLGLGIPGLVITVLAVFNAFNKCLKSKNYYAKSGVWVLPLLSFAFLTSEVCEKTSWDMFLFMIAFYSIVSIEDV
jgi:hypothetical protein